MKKLILIAALLTATVATYGQGQLIFANAGPTRITNNLTGQSVVAGARVGLYVGNVGDPAGSLTLVATTPTVAVPQPGIFTGGTVTLAGRIGGSQVAWQVRAWLASTVYASYEAAYAGALGGDNTVVIGQSGIHTITLTEPPAGANSIANFGLEAIRLSPVPEPSSIALGLLGLGAVALFRRRK
jgi:hypothetical protein